ncbi:MAG: L,D-transpeptidase family protein [Betaproteobacteria bacterium]|nr:L,D-transpeptidase family protein [Betaproteobacteria bacterium]
MRGDLLLARVRPIAGLGNPVAPGGEPLEDLRAEARARLRANVPDGDRVPRYFLKPDSSQRTAILIDASRSRVYVYDTAAAVPRLLRDYYTSIGKHGSQKEREGDRKTPLGVYHVTAWIPGGKLPDLYGSGAYPIDYPNARDRLVGRTGHGIWIHGVPSNTYARAPLASDGCLALANPDLESLAAYVQPGVTPVVIARQVEWVEPAQLRAERDSILARIETWRLDWESGDSERYLLHYGKDFRTSDKDLDGWRAHKRRVSAQKNWIRVTLKDIGAQRDPGAMNLVTVTFEQEYRSSNLSERSRKRQYWALEQGGWKIVYEAPLSAPILSLPESFPDTVRAGKATGGKG